MKEYNQAKDTFWYTNGEIDKRFKEGEEDSGFVKGRSLIKGGHTYQKVTCPYCGKEGGGNMIRYHFENCKFKNK